MSKLSFIIPAYNEEKNLPKLYSELKKNIDELQVKYEIIFVNDGSQDKTLEVFQALKIEDKNLKMINLSRNFGYESAVKAGLDLVDGDYIVIMDADLQDPPQVVQKLYETIKSGYDIVLAKRESRSDGFFKDKTARFFYRFINVFSSVDIPKDVGYFRIFSKQVLEEVRKFGEYSLFLKGIFSFVGFKVGTIEYTRPERFQGETKISPKKLFKLAFRGIVSFSTVPLQRIMRIGFLCASVSFIIGIIQIILKLAHPESYQYGVSTIVVLIAFITGIQLLALGILGVYVGKIYEETKKRPVYIIKSVE